MSEQISQMIEEDRNTQGFEASSDIGRITVLEALATETNMISPDALGRTTIDASGNDMDD